MFGFLSGIFGFCIRESEASGTEHNPSLVPHQKHHHHGVAKMLMIYTNGLLFRSAFHAPSILQDSM